MDENTDGLEAQFTDEIDATISRLDDVEHPCHNCILANRLAIEHTLLSGLKQFAQSSAGETHEFISGQLEQLFEESGFGDMITQDEIRQRVGKYMARSIDGLDGAIAESFDEFERLIEACDGPLSLVGNKNERTVGVIACGSELLPDGDNLAENVYITRFRTI